MTARTSKRQHAATAPPRMMPVPSLTRSTQEAPLRPRRVLAGALLVAALLLAGPSSESFAYAGRGISPLKEDVEVLGVLRGRLVVGYHMSLEAVNVFANGTRLKPMKGNNWRKQEIRYGERDCKYAEFAIPPLPADINVLGRVVGGQILVNAMAPVTHRFLVPQYPTFKLFGFL
ncbi:unnamed protein product [Symbiodinium sp. CCMP2456]|nr:unnamed protein product [Symbiodinium sp. CCMP2456]